MDTQLFVAALSRSGRLADDPRSPAGDGQGPGQQVGGSQLQKGTGNGKPAAQGEGKGKPAGKPAYKGKAPTRAGSAKPGAKPAIQGGKPAAKGNGAKRPVR